MKKGFFSTAMLLLVFLIGLSLLLYPTVSDYWNSLHQSQAITHYADQVAMLDDGRFDQLWDDAYRYNQSLTQKLDRYAMSDQDREEYESILNITGEGILGSIDIPAIGVSLPIYHGTESSVLQSAHRPYGGLVLPTGGKGHPLRPLRPPGASLRPAVYGSGSDDRGGSVHPADFE